MPITSLLKISIVNYEKKKVEIAADLLSAIYICRYRILQRNRAWKKSIQLIAQTKDNWVYSNEKRTVFIVQLPTNAMDEKIVYLLLPFENVYSIMRTHDGLYTFTCVLTALCRHAFHYTYVIVVIIVVRRHIFQMAYTAYVYVWL